MTCLEYFIARKVREVFDVYSEVFHTVAKLSREDLAQMVLDVEREKRALKG